jgi:hypothetical protein
LLLSLVVPLAIVRGTTYAWGWVPPLLWILTATCWLLWVGTANRVTDRVPYRLVRKHDHRSPQDGGDWTETRQAINAILMEIDAIRSRALEVLEGGDSWDYAIPLPTREWFTYRGVLARDLSQDVVQLAAEAYKTVDRINRVDVSDELLEAAEDKIARAEVELSAILAEGDAGNEYAQPRRLGTATAKREPGAGDS